MISGLKETPIFDDMGVAFFCGQLSRWHLKYSQETERLRELQDITQYLLPPLAGKDIIDI